jgi:hypothetical protein
MSFMLQIAYAMLLVIFVLVVSGVFPTLVRSDRANAAERTVLAEELQDSRYS